ncbi:hypothetical protein EON64_08040 [archaeon]|nr:MAG: hypothetical protein EON64_08040 [archaeon]
MLSYYSIGSAYTFSPPSAYNRTRKRLPSGGDGVGIAGGTRSRLYSGASEVSSGYVTESSGALQEWDLSDSFDSDDS